MLKFLQAQTQLKGNNDFSSMEINCALNASTKCLKTRVLTRQVVASDITIPTTIFIKHHSLTFVIHVNFLLYLSIYVKGVTRD